VGVGILEVLIVVDVGEGGCTQDELVVLQLFFATQPKSLALLTWLNRFAPVTLLD